MPNDNADERAQARARIKELESMAEHTQPDAIAAAQTIVDDINDPKHHGKPDDKARGRWREVAPGVYSDPDADD